tara:strand:+ start:259 stop:1338 length:1080 start_codon:yes stop_codon:yes gene_type:complete
MGTLFVFEAVRMKDLGVGESTIGLILGSSSGLLIVASIYWGRFADRKGFHKEVVLWGTIGYFILVFFFAYCQTAWQFFIYAIARSILMPMIAGIMPAIAVKAHGTEQQGSKFGIYRAFGSLGFILGTMILPLIFNDIALTAQVSSVFMVISLFLLRRLPKPEVLTVEAVPLHLRTLNPLIRWYFFAMFFISLADPAVHGFFTAYARDLGGSTRLLGILSGSFGIIAFFFLPAMGMAIDRYRPTLILTIALFCQPVRVFLPSLIDDPNFLWIPILLHGICWGGIEVVAIVYLSRLVEEDQKASVLSYYMAVRMLGNLVGASICGYVAENFGYVMMFQVISSMALVGAVIYMWSTFFGKRE